MNENEKCQSIYQSLLVCLDESHQSNNFSNTKLQFLFVRELFGETETNHPHCDLKSLRDDYTARINTGDPIRLQRILKFQENNHADKKVIFQAYVHNSRSDQKTLVSALNWPNWFAYRVIDPAERAVKRVFGVLRKGTEK